MTRCIIVEDEVLAQQVIQKHLEKIDSFELVAICNNVREAKVVLDQQQVDLIFLDIELPGMNGLSFLRSLASPPLTVLTTAYAGHALEGYELNVVDYLLKPISFERFSKTIKKITDNDMIPADAKRKSDHIFVRSNGKFLKIDFADISYVEGMKDYLKIHTSSDTVITHQTMSDMERILPSLRFMRVHKSYIVAIPHIKSIYGNTVEIGKSSIPIGINYKDKVMKLVR